MTPMEVPRPHDFRRSLALSRSYVDAPWWVDVYRSAFPGLASAVAVPDDGWAQRGGIDRVLTLNSGRVVYIDEKVRERDWPDILLERWSDEAAKTPGWVQKPLACEFIAYAFVPSQTCYLLPAQTLQRAWRVHGRNWIDTYREVRADNGRYVTVSVPVPIPTLMTALSDAMTVRWVSRSELTVEPHQGRAA